MLVLELEDEDDDDEEEEDDELELLEELDELDEPAVVGLKKSLLEPKPTFDANSPPTEIVALVFWAVRTMRPLLLR